MKRLRRSGAFRRFENLNDNDIQQSNEAGSGYASGATGPLVRNLGMSGPNTTRFSAFNIVAKKTNRSALPDNRWRNYLMFQNNSTATIFIGFGVNVGSNGENGFAIAAGGFYEIDRSVPFNAIFVLGTANSQQLLIIEGIVDRAQVRAQVR